jgi:Tfp pilus assembly protein PilX
MKKHSIYSVFKKQTGQALLVVVLVMVIALTVGLTIATKSITNFRSSTDLANSQKALSAAEAGVEQALKQDKSVNNSTFTSNTGYQTILSKIGGSPTALTFLLNGGNPVSQDTGIDLWLSDYSTDSAKLYQNQWSGNFTLYWGDNSGDCNNAAVEIVIISGTKANPVLTKNAYDPCAARRGVNHFSPITSTQYAINGTTFYYKTDPQNVNSGFFARIIPLYTNAVIGIVNLPDNPILNYPTQGSVVTSVGSSGSTQRRVNVFQGYPALPTELFLYNLFSP